jgi:hypothetical protein
MDRRSFVGAGVSGLLLLPLAANPQPRGKIARLGFLAGFPRLTTQGSISTTIAERLRELGYVEGIEPAESIGSVCWARLK